MRIIKQNILRNHIAIKKIHLNQSIKGNFLLILVVVILKKIDIIVLEGILEKRSLKLMITIIIKNQNIKLQII